MAKKILTPEEIKEEQLSRLVLGDCEMTHQESLDYLSSDDVMNTPEGVEIPLGFKRCGRCREVKKFFLFNKNTSNKTGCTGNCKACQAAAAKVSYKKTKKKRNYAKYYQENKDIKREAARKYYEANKEIVDAKHKAYVSSKAGKKVMQRAREKRNGRLESTLGVPYTPELIIQRDAVDGIVTCYLCNQPIEDLKGSHVDHVIGLAIGGYNCFTNVMLVHGNCNLRKSKDCREVMPETTEDLLKRSEQFIEDNLELFE